MSVAVKVKNVTMSQITAIDCAKRFCQLAVSGKSFEEIVKVLTPDFYNSEKDGDPAKQIKAKVTLARNVFEAKPKGAYAYHELESPTTAEWIADCMKKAGLGKRGRSATKLSATDRDKLANLLKGFGPSA